MALSTDPAARRRLGALAATAVAALGVGAAVGATGGDEPPPSAPPRTQPARRDASPPAPPRLTVTQLAGQAVILRFAGTTAPAYVRRALRRKRVAGVILFRDNVPTAASTRRLTRSLQRAAGGRALICTDQEGGDIRVLAYAPPENGQATMTTPTAVAAASRAAARALRRAGINVSLAPVVDVGGPGQLMRGRAFPGDPADVARAAAAAVRAYRGTGVAPTVKHFPGLGAADANTDDAAVTIERSARDIGAADLPPFKAAIAAGAPIVMTSHARYSALDAGAVASQSRTISTDLLRGRLGFRGVVMTDSLEAEAVSGQMDPGEAAVRSVRAGADLVLTTGRGSYLPALRALAREARRDPDFRARLREAVARVEALRDSL